MYNRIFASMWLIFVALTSIPLYLGALIIRIITYPFDRKLRLLHLYTCFWGSSYTYLNPRWKIMVEGRNRARKGVTYMIVSNHQSQLDILVAFKLFIHYKWVSKAEIFKVPLIGWNMMLNQYVRLVRGDKESIARMMKDAEARLAEGSSVYFFPEGSRSPDEHVKPFKPGAFILAHKMKIPILPVAISGTNKALPKYSMNLHDTQKIIIRVLDEIPYEKFKDLSVEETSDLVRNIIIAEVDKLNKITLSD